MKQSRAGLTLIELMVVMAILAILITMGWMAWQNQIAKARDADRKGDLHRIQVAFEDYYNDHNCYPPANILDQCGDNDPGNLKPYLEKIPCDPTTDLPYCYVYDSNDPEGQEFRLLAALENDSDSDIDNLGCAGAGFCNCNIQCDPFGSGFNYGVCSTNITVKCEPPAHVKRYYCQDIGIHANCTEYYIDEDICTPSFPNPICDGCITELGHCQPL